MTTPISSSSFGYSNPPSKEFEVPIKFLQFAYNLVSGLRSFFEINIPGKFSDKAVYDEYLDDVKELLLNPGENKTNDIKRAISLIDSLFEYMEKDHKITIGKFYINKDLRLEAEPLVNLFITYVLRVPKTREDPMFIEQIEASIVQAQKDYNNGRLQPLDFLQKLLDINNTLLAERIIAHGSININAPL